MQFVQFFLRCRIEFLLLSVELKRDIIIAMYRFFDRADIILENHNVRSEFSDIILKSSYVRFESADIIFEIGYVCFDGSQF